MNIRQLIEKLQDFPEDAEVIILHDVIQPLEEDDIKLDHWRTVVHISCRLVD